ncbi:MAG TPA: hypothetical protein VIM98_04120 [Dyella sp.]|uniref:hypothetical protein n=1 Tax=Dyella sp. TaxID=1869338 RepID=UPI002F9226AD
MSDERPSNPYRPPATNQPGIDPPVPSGQGSIVLGIVLAWGVMIVGVLALAGVANVMPALLYGWFVPPLAVAIVGLVLMRAGKRRTGKGMLLGLASVFGVLVLLVAACFGLVMVNGGFGGL